MYSSRTQIILRWTVNSTQQGPLVNLEKNLVSLVVFQFGSQIRYLKGNWYSTWVELFEKCWIYHFRRSIKHRLFRLHIIGNEATKSRGSLINPTWMWCAAFSKLKTCFLYVVYHPPLDDALMMRSVKKYKQSSSLNVSTSDTFSRLNLFIWRECTIFFTISSYRVMVLFLVDFRSERSQSLEEII